MPPVHPVRTHVRGAYDVSVDPTTQAALAALVGAIVAGGAVLAWHISDRQRHTAPQAEPPVVQAGVAAVLSILRSSAVVVDESDHVLKASAPAYAFGLVRGNTVLLPELLDLIAQVRRDGQIRESDIDMPALDGGFTRTLTARVAPLGARLVLALVEDRTRERRVEAVRRDFVANVSHELKTPVGAIRLLAEAVTDAADDPEAVQRFAGRMLTESDRLSKLVQQIIELSRLQGNDPLERPVMVDLDAAVATAVDTSAMEAAAKQITVESRGEPGLEVFGSQEQIGAAISNLVANAVAYSNAGSRVVVTTRSEGDPRPDLGGRPGHRHPGRRHRPHLRALLPRRPRAPPLDGRHRPRPLDRQARRGHPRRRHRRVVGAGTGLDLHPHASPPLGARPGHRQHLPGRGRRPRAAHHRHRSRTTQSTAGDQ